MSHQGHRAHFAKIGKDRCRANMAHVNQSRPDSGLDFQVNVLDTCHGLASLLDSGSLAEANVCNLVSAESIPGR